MQAVCDRVYNLLHSEPNLGQLEFFLDGAHKLDVTNRGEIQTMHPMCMRTIIGLMGIMTQFEQIHAECLEIIKAIDSTVLNNQDEMKKYEDYPPITLSLAAHTGKYRLFRHMHIIDVLIVAMIGFSAGIVVERWCNQ